MVIGGERPTINPTAVNAILVDPGNGGTISGFVSGSLSMDSTGVETRTLVRPDHLGQTLDLSFGLDGGNITVSLSPSGATDEGDLIFANSGDLAHLVGVVNAADDLRWNVVIRVSGTSFGAPTVTFT